MASKSSSSTKEAEAWATPVEDARNGGGAALEDTDGILQRLANEAPPFYKSRNLLMLYLLLIPGGLMPAVTLGFDGAMMNGLQAVPAWDNCCIVATPFISIVGDRFGRRVGICTGAAIMLVGGIIQGASVNIGMFLASRFILGFGLVFSNTYAPMIIGELAHPKDRTVATSLYQTSWYIGAALAAWTTFGTFRIPTDWAWRIPSYMQAAPALIQIIFIFFLPESPRWLIANGRPEEAKAFLIKYHAEGDSQSQLANLEYKEIRAVIEAEMANEIGWMSLLKTPGNRRRMLIIMMLGAFSQLSGNGLVSYYLVRVLATVGITDPQTQNIINGCLMIFNWVCSVGSAFATTRFKRRTQFLISVVGMWAVFTFQTLCAGLFNEQGNRAAGLAVIGMLFLFYVFFNFAFNALLYSYPVEILPYSIRAKGFSVLMFFGKGFSFVNAFVNPIGLQGLGWKYYAVYVAWLGVETFCVWKFFVETKGPSLEAIAARFDGDKVAVDTDRLAKKEDSRD
ncbi:uncharacterized protein B0I36DRAFT_297721 [Microdochium trichocladiopsis]|uniref:Major facilitator superfamily (MFS) profile domain-containing protein n=1 Tax=Microdochium trichocladiopsis TaxID=1682393 RepID=A0A9P8XX96_9PEZI|nr:uncharacterized protein B0I36DRAFT_297721 [Microdochium trichocladiopsis]KAH7018177.1 hypothetical protein B0I36DRAFT_297721 [Microdochium trichocladiopsis]